MAAIVGGTLGVLGTVKAIFLAKEGKERLNEGVMLSADKTRTFAGNLFLLVSATTIVVGMMITGWSIVSLPLGFGDAITTAIERMAPYIFTWAGCLIFGSALRNAPQEPIEVTVLSEGQEF